MSEPGGSEKRGAAGSGEAIVKSWPELHQRLLDLAAALREQGIVWRPFANREAEAQRRRSRVPDEVVASLKSFLRETFAIARGKPTAADCERFSRRFRELSAPLRAR